MSTYNNFRQISDDIWDFCEWINEMKRELRGEKVHPEQPENEEREDEKDD